ncbi:MAG: tetraacyldisaccharide 4'-kinase [Chlorobi bacterium]|nr:tetraacyldisaccharide 4'-kinase [Chlorobiota bacterium]
MTERLRLLLKPAALLYRAIVQFRNLGFEKKVLKSWQAPLPVVSIGNITAGGTGKTPLADWIIRYYRSLGEKPALLSRGYGRITKGVRLVSDGKDILLGSREAGDEVAMLAAKNPGLIAVVAEKRKQGAEFILGHFGDRCPSVLILDDAFQHRQVARNLDIVVINAGERYFDAEMLPAGRLREPRENIVRADLAVLNKITDRTVADAIAGDLGKKGVPAVRARTVAGELKPFPGALLQDGTRGIEACYAFAGIGAPEGFLDTLKEKGLQVGAYRFFRDHEPYTHEKLVPILQEAREKGLRPVTTEKDYFRLLDMPELCLTLAAHGCCYLNILMEITEGRETLEAMLQSVLSTQENRKTTP